MSASNSELRIVETLLALHELKGVGDVTLVDLAQNSRIEKYPSASALRADGHVDRRLYLISGIVAIKVDGKVLHTIEAGTERASLPLFRVKTHGLMGICQSAVELLSIEEETFERHIAVISPNNSGISLEEYSQEINEPGVVTEAHLDFVHTEVDLPSMPETAMRIYRILQQEDCTVSQVADAVKLDPVIAVRIVQVANSAMYAMPVKIESIKDAITRIGLNTTHAIVMSVVLKNLFTPESPLIRNQFKKFYHHSIRVAAIAYALARHLKDFNPDEALLAGLIHDIGVLPLLIEADHSKKLLEHEAELENILRTQSHSVGARLLHQWGFEEVFIQVAAGSEDWSREVATADYCDLIQIAQLHCAIIGGRKMEAPAISEIPAFHRLGLANVDPQNIIKEAKHEIHEIVELFMSP